MSAAKKARIEPGVNAAPKSLKLMYFDGRGLMELPRTLLATAGKFPGKDYEDFRYPVEVCSRMVALSRPCPPPNGHCFVPHLQIDEDTPPIHPLTPEGLSSVVSCVGGREPHSGCINRVATV